MGNLNMMQPPLILAIILLLCCCSSCLAFSSLSRTSAAVKFIRNNHGPGQTIYAISAEESNNGETQQRGMEEAFASLDALSPSDWNDDEKKHSNNGEEYVSELKYSRTDETGASDTGKATKEEVELYLEMTTELDGTAAIKNIEEDDEEEDINIDQIEPDLDDIMDIEDTENSDINDDFPWEAINPILRLRGPVATGYGRGGKKLGVPTANLPASLFQSALEDVETGVYFGWAVIEGEKQGRDGPIKAVVNVGYSPTFEGKENKEKIAEAHLITKSSPMVEIDEASISDNVLDQGEESDIIDEIEDDFYGETMRLQLIGFLRPEQKFDSFPDLIAQIHRDIGTASVALKAMPFIFSKEDAFIQDGAEWVGSGGGNDVASWEFETW
jgi:riboflavin kinase